ncbi:MarR family winged helix-turn-helix transcriptional regulator [Streptomyces sp. NBC_00859]|uniref:MarR family winged helix-turn-helix transcriptional regulator n=1 Tax=Streptomyces sp. NBC_00859 TaxID=2903682 RepID=UPI00386CF4C6|nr:MarR family winged helix-turn-helix transcriptional regulator [Streptomyces sp. NBC_00859]
MADDRAAVSAADGRGYELPMLLFAGFRAAIDQLHARLADEGHPDVRPAYGFAMQAIGVRGATASEMGRRLGVSKQAAGKTVERLEELGYAERAADPSDGRRKIVVLTARGVEVLVRSGQFFDELYAQWARVLGPERLAGLESDLRALVPGAVPGGGFRVDVAGWFGG